MAVFDLSNPEQFNQLDWQILTIGAVSLYLDHTVLEEACLWFQEHHYCLYHFNCGDWHTIEDFYASINQALTLPFHCSNLDALSEVLVDIDVSEESGTLYIFWSFDSFVRLFPAEASHLLDILENISRRFLLTGQRFISLVQLNDTTLTFSPVGARPVILNPIEKMRRIQHAIRKRRSHEA